MEAADLKEAVENFKTTARYFRSFLDLADHIEAIGDIQRAEQEATQNLAQLRKDVAAETTTLDGLKTQTSEIIETARIEAGGIVKTANDEAARITLDASNKAEDALSSVRKEAETKKSAAEAVIKKLEARKQDAADLAEKEEKRLFAAETELAAVEQKLADARAAVTKMLEG